MKTRIIFFRKINLFGRKKLSRFMSLFLSWNFFIFDARTRRDTSNNWFTRRRKKKNDHDARMKFRIPAIPSSCTREARRRRSAAESSKDPRFSPPGWFATADTEGKAEDGRKKHDGADSRRRLEYFARLGANSIAGFIDLTVRRLPCVWTAL